jgi:enediyne biosynthesis protein E4
MGVVWGDYDGDDDQDLFVANDEMPNVLFRNNGNGTFTEVGVPAGAALSPDGRAQGSMGRLRRLRQRRRSRSGRDQLR